MMQKLLCFILLLTVIGCREKYVPDLPNTSTNFLVVEGYINSGTGPTNFRLSRSLRLVDTALFKPETGASVSVQGKDNSNFALVYKGEGVYSADQLTLNPNQQYRLFVKTADGKEYASEYVEIKPTPAIDSVSWVQNANGVQIYANTHDPLNKTKYYKWEYEETWEIQSSVAAEYDYRDNKIIEVDPYAEKIVTCWKSLSSSQILIGTTAALSNDVMNLQPITFIPNRDERLAIRYSVIVRQYALTPDAYEFHRLMKKNTEELGSIFGPLPSEMRGNIKNIADQNEPVIGFVSASSVQEQRIFINAAQVPNWKFLLPCTEHFVVNNPDSIRFYFPYYRPYGALKDPGGNISGYFGITPSCADCRLRKGVNVKPSFW